MKSSIDLLTEHVWRFLDTYEEFEYKAITFLPPDTILKFSTGKDIGIGRIIPLKVSHDYCLVDIVWNTTTRISKSGGAIDPFCIDSEDIIKVCGNLSLKWKEISDALKKDEEVIKKNLTSIATLADYNDIAMECLYTSVEHYFQEVGENLYLRLILSHRNDPPRPYP